MEQPVLDTKPGPYYVSVIDGGKAYLMAGPYATHAEALADVDKAREIAGNNDGRSLFMAWGTCRKHDPRDNAPGRLNQLNLI